MLQHQFKTAKYHRYYNAITEIQKGLREQKDVSKGLTSFVSFRISYTRPNKYIFYRKHNILFDNKMKTVSVFLHIPRFTSPDTYALEPSTQKQQVFKTIY